CANKSGPLLVAIDPQIGFRTITCPPSEPYCSPLPPVCPIDPAVGIPSTLEPIQAEPCVELACWQNVTPAMLCNGLPTCNANPTDEEAPVSYAVDRTGDGIPDCVDVTCEVK